jgi:hypothetical protein
MFSYDPALLDAVRTNPRTVDDVLGIMRTIETTCIDGDGLKWFNWLYMHVTQAVEARVSSGGFADPGWIATLDVQFAILYFGALRAALSSETTPGCWQTLFDCRNVTSLARIQFALAGINAHINHDLPEAIVATCRLTATAPQHATAHYDDYTSLNSTLSGLVESAKQTLHVRLLGDALPPVSHLENTIAAWNVSAAREAAWQNSELAPARCTAAVLTIHQYVRWIDHRSWTGSVDSDAVMRTTLRQATRITSNLVDRRSDRSDSPESSPY